MTHEQINLETFALLKAMRNPENRNDLPQAQSHRSQRMDSECRTITDLLKALSPGARAYVNESDESEFITPRKMARLENLALDEAAARLDWYCTHRKLSKSELAEHLAAGIITRSMVLATLSEDSATDYTATESAKTALDKLIYGTGIPRKQAKDYAANIIDNNRSRRNPKDSGGNAGVFTPEVQDWLREHAIKLLHGKHRGGVKATNSYLFKHWNIPNMHETTMRKYGLLQEK